MFAVITDLLGMAIRQFDETTENVPSSVIVLATATLAFLYQQYHNPSIARAYRARHTVSLQQRLIDIVYDLVKSWSPVKAFVDKELDKHLASSRAKLAVERSKMNLQEKMPEAGRSPAEILQEFNVDTEDCLFDFDSVMPGDYARNFIISNDGGKDSGALYAAHPRELNELLRVVIGQSMLSNPMHDKWPRIVAMQAEVISWCKDLFHCSSNGYGLITHGGTGSIMEAMLAYVHHAKKRGIQVPEIIVPETAHAAFDKTALKASGAVLIVVPVDPKTGAVSAQKMRGYLSRNTAVMVGSAPSFMYGICDPISELGQLAIEFNIPFHVDACLGGFVTAFLDTSKNPFDFKVKGVTSISADLHKYGYCPKDLSVCLFSEDSPAIPVYAALNWSGGLYTSPGLLDGSTSGARIAEAYATLSYYGRERYENISKSIVALRAKLQQEVSRLTSSQLGFTSDEIMVFGDPQLTLLGFRSKTLNVHMIANELEIRGWKLNFLQNPDGFHFCLTHVHTLVDGLVENFCSDLKDSVLAVMAYPKDKKPSGNVKVYGAVGFMPTELQERICVEYQKDRQGLSFARSTLFPALGGNEKDSATSVTSGSGMAMK